MAPAGRSGWCRRSRVAPPPSGGRVRPTAWTSVVSRGPWCSRAIWPRVPPAGCPFPTFPRKDHQYCFGRKKMRTALGQCAM
eukprot:1627711-Prymnesium_polylepis.1